MLCRNYTCSPTEKPPEQHYKSLVSRQLTNGGGTITVEEFPFKWSGYTYISHIAYQKGKEPKPHVLMSMIKKAKANNVQAILTQPEFSQKGAKLIANELNIKVVGISPLNPKWSKNLINLANSIANNK